MRAAALAALLLASAPAPSRAQKEAQEATGVAPLSGGDAARARAEALTDALKCAIEQAVAEAAPEARGRLYLVLARARDFVPAYRVLEEGAAGGQFQVRIAATVDLPRLLRELQAAPPAPRPTGRGAVQICAEEPEAQALLAPLHEALSDRAEVLPCAGGPPGALVLTVRGPADLGRTAPIRGTQPPLYGAAARVQLVLGPGDRARSEESAEANGFGPTPAEALASAGRAALDSCLLRLQPALGTALPPLSAAGVLVSVEGLDSYAALQQVLRTLSAISGVSGAEARRFARRDGALLAEVLLRTTADAEPLGAAIGRTPLGGLRLQVVPQDRRRLRLLVVRERALPQAPPPEAPR